MQDAELRLIMTQIADEAARKAVHETLMSLGIDARDPIEAQRDMAALREVRLLISDEEFKRDLYHLRRWRKTMNAVESKGFIAALGMMIMGGASLIIYAFRVKLFGL